VSEDILSAAALLTFSSAANELSAPAPRNHQSKSSSKAAECPPHTLFGFQERSPTAGQGQAFREWPAVGGLSIRVDTSQVPHALHRIPGRPLFRSSRQNPPEGHAYPNIPYEGRE